MATVSDSFQIMRLGPPTLISPLTARFSAQNFIADDARVVGVSDADALARALAQLTPEDREALVLRAQEALSYAEIAQILGTSEGAVKVRVHRARKRLLSLMDRSAGPPSSGGRP